MMRAILFVLFALLAAPPAFAGPDIPVAVEAENGPERLSDPALEARAVALQKQFRCLVCQGESLDESNADLAKDLRRLIRAQIAAGASDGEIERYLVSRYGDFILMKPPLAGETYVLWFGPLGVLLIAGAVAAWAVVRARRRVHSATH